MRWAGAALALVLVVIFGVWVAGPPIQHRQVRIALLPADLPSFAAGLSFRFSEPLPLPSGSHSAPGAIPPPSIPLVNHLWEGQHTYTWPLSEVHAIRWARRHVRSEWRASGSGQSGINGHIVSRWLSWNADRVPHETMTLEFAREGATRTRVTVSCTRIVLPGRPSDTEIPPEAQSVILIYHRRATQVERTVVTQPSEIRAFIQKVNAAPVAIMGVGGCEAQIPGTVTLRFRSNDATSRVQYTPACGWFSVNGKKPLLGGDLAGVINRALKSAHLKPMFSRIWGICTRIMAKRRGTVCGLFDSSG